MTSCSARGVSPGSICLVTEPEQPRQASTGLDERVAEDFSQVLGFLTNLLVQLVAEERRLPVHFFSHALDVAERTVLLTAAPGCHRGRIHLLQIVVSTSHILKNSSTEYHLILRHGSNELDSSSSTERSRPVMLSAAKHLAADGDRPFASLRVTRCDCSNCQGRFVQIEPCLKKNVKPLAPTCSSIVCVTSSQDALLRSNGRIISSQCSAGPRRASNASITFSYGWVDATTTCSMVMGVVCLIVLSSFPQAGCFGRIQ